MIFAARMSPTPLRARSSSSVAVLMSSNCLAADFAAGFALTGLAVGAGVAVLGTAGWTACARQGAAKAADTQRYKARMIFLGSFMGFPFWQSLVKSAWVGSETGYLNFMAPNIRPSNSVCSFEFFATNSKL